ncbi:MAG: serine hydrolase [Anaerolineae bacterium]|nr:serine hydrolase [Anaerolineae bacterium]
MADTSNSMITLLNDIRREADGFSGHVGFAARRVDADKAILLNADDIFPTASVIKLVVLVEYLAQVAAGELLPISPITLQPENLVEGSGVLKDLQPGAQMTLHDLATLSITISDNTASNMLIEAVGGLARINTRLHELGMTQTVMGRPFVFDSPVDNTGSPADFLHLLLALAQGQVVSPTVSRQVLDLMGRQQFMTYIPRYLPYHPFAAEYGLLQPLTIANKVGMLRGTVNDAALITTSGYTYGLVIFTRACTDTRPDPDNEAALLVARLSKRVYDYFEAQVTSDEGGS